MKYVYFFRQELPRYATTSYLSRPPRRILKTHIPNILSLSGEKSAKVDLEEEAEKEIEVALLMMMGG